MSDELLPCPFCGGNAVKMLWAGIYGKHAVACTKCACATDWMFHNQAIAAWNRRCPTNPQPVGQVPDGLPLPSRDQQHAISVFAVWWAMWNADAELAEEPINDEAVILHYSGCGASSEVRAKHINLMLDALKLPPAPTSKESLQVAPAAPPAQERARFEKWMINEAKCIVGSVDAWADMAIGPADEARYGHVTRMNFRAVAREAWNAALAAKPQAGKPEALLVESPTGNWSTLDLSAREVYEANGHTVTNLCRCDALPAKALTNERIDYLVGQTLDLSCEPPSRDELRALVRACFADAAKGKP